MIFNTKSNAMDKAVYYIRGVLSLIAILFFNQLQAQEIRLQIVNTKGEAQFGVYAVETKNHYLLASTDIDGECVIRTYKLQTDDSIQFQGIGYQTVKYSLKDLLLVKKIVLVPLAYELDETTVGKGISMKELLKKAALKLKKQAPDIVPLCKYFGKTLYEKITECESNTVEYRREYGYYFSSGDVKPRSAWDTHFRSYIVPLNVARSYNLTNDGKDTINPTFVSDEEARFDIGTRKIFTFMRSIQLYAPLFSDIRNYDIYPLESNNSDYRFAFKTKSSAYPYKTRLTCRGTFTIDGERHELKTMDFDYVDYQLFRQVLLSKYRKVNSPFATKAKFSFAYTPTKECYIQSCTQETTWKYDLGDNFIVFEQPSRSLPSGNRLIEKEAFYCFNYQQIPSKWQTSRVLSKIHLAQRYPTGTYNKEVFQDLTPLLDNRKAIQDLSQYMDIEEQFQRNSDIPYYGQYLIIGINSGLIPLTDFHPELISNREEVFSLVKKFEQFSETIPEFQSDYPNGEVVYP